MAVRVQNTNIIAMGTLTAQTVVTHGRLKVGASVLATRALTTQRTVAAGGALQFDAGDIDVIFKSNQLTDAGLNALLALALDGSNEITVEAMTSSTQEITTSGYSEQDVSAWSRSTEND